MTHTIKMHGDTKPGINGHSPCLRRGIWACADPDKRIGSRAEAWSASCLQVY
jgi:hypothetical protein